MMAFWVVDNIWSYLHEATVAEEAELYAAFKIRPKQYFFDFRFRSGMWDGWTYFYDMTSKRILTGLLDIVDEMGHVFERRYGPTCPITEFGDASLPGITFTSKQSEAIALVHTGKNRGIFAHTTGSGKTALAAALTKSIGLRTIILVPSIALLSQTADEMQRFTGLKFGKIGGGKHEANENHLIVVGASLKKLPAWRLEKLAANVQVLHMDECHNCTELLHPFLSLCKDAYFRFGYSGTPFDLGDDRSVFVQGFFGPTINVATNQDLVESGRGVPAHFIFVEVNLPPVITTPTQDESRMVDYTDMYRQCVVDNFDFHTTVAGLVHKHHDNETSILVLTRLLKQADILQRMLKERGVPCELTTGKHSPYKREETKAKFKDGRIKVLIASDIYKEGVDIPCIDMLVLAGAGESTKDWTQRVGRGLRSHPGKEEVIVYDFNFKGVPIFEKHSKRRIAMAQSLSGSKVSFQTNLLSQMVLLPSRLANS